MIMGNIVTVTRQAKVTIQSTSSTATACLVLTPFESLLLEKCQVVLYVWFSSFGALVKMETTLGFITWDQIFTSILVEKEFRRFHLIPGERV